MNKKPSKDSDTESEKDGMVGETLVSLRNIRIVKKTKPKLKPCEMNCDSGLHDKLNKYEMTKFMNTHATNLLIGRPGSGKTSICYSFFQSKELFRKVFHNVFLFQPSHSRASMKDDLFDTIPQDQRYDELNYETLSEVMQRIKNEDKKYNNCIIFDDMTAYLKNNETKQLLKELIFNRRHISCSIFFLVQTWFSIEKDIRKLFSNIFVFKVSKKELETIFDEVIEQKKEYIGEISKMVYNEPYKYLFINTESQRLFSDFNEILITE